MARITTRDCERVVPNRYELVLLAAELARELHRERAPQSDRQREHMTVTALRRIAAGKADPDSLRINRRRRPKALPLLAEAAEHNASAARFGPEPRHAQAA